MKLIYYPVALIIFLYCLPLALVYVMHLGAKEISNMFDDKMSELRENTRRTK